MDQKDNSFMEQSESCSQDKSLSDSSYENGCGCFERESAGMSCSTPDSSKDSFTTEQDQLKEEALSDSINSENETTPEETAHSQDSRKAEKHKDHSNQHAHASHSAYQTFIKRLEELTDIEAKLLVAIEFMESSLSQTGSPQFKNFWEAQKTCLALFKENISPSVRVSLWARYSELCREARRLKEIFDEQSSFAAEQIDIAVSGLEQELNHLDEQIDKLADLEFGITSKVLEKDLSFYNNVQKELNLLNAYAARINALRKELIKTEMRVKQKNKFFERLSALGDRVFPRRKQLIKEVSQHFSKNVDDFIQGTFVGELKAPALFQAREEIKALQGMAKILTLNNEAFSQTRARLSECWDSIKLLAKEHKKNIAQQKADFKKNKELLSAELAQVKVDLEGAVISVNEAFNRFEAITHRAKEVQLGKDELRVFREEMRSLKDFLNDHQQQEEAGRKKALQKKENEAHEKVELIRKSIEEVISSATDFSLEELEAKREDFQKKIATSQATKAQKQELEKLLKSLRDILSDKKEQQLLALPAGQRQTLEQLKLLLKQRKDHRQQIKSQLETYRRLSGSSGLDFSQAMHYNDLIESEKQSLEKVEAGIEELETQIEDLENQAG